MVSDSSKMGERAALLAIVVLGSVAAGLSALPEHLPRFAFHPVAAFSSPWWQWLSGHLVHITATHLLANLLALLLLAQWARQQGRLASLLPVLLWSALAVDVGLLVCGPMLAWYAGLSGALHGVFAWLALNQHAAGQGFQRYRLRLTLWLLGLAKLGLDLLAGLPWSGFKPVPQAHAYGFVAGSLAALLVYLRRRR